MKFTKQISFIILIAFIIAYVLLVVITFCDLSDYSQSNSTHIDKPTIIIDAGHGGEDGGAVANNIVEKDINLSISLILADIFKSNGYNVITTRDKDIMINTYGETLRERKVSDMKNRLALYNKNPNNIVISIHQNLFTDSQYNGTQIFYSTNDTNSLKLAECVKKSVNTFLQPDNNRETKPATKDIFLLNNTTSTAIIVECGFISNVSEAEKLKTYEYQKQLSFCIFTGFMEFYNNRG